MPKQVQKQVESSKTQKTETVIDQPPETAHKSPEALKAEMDALLDDIEEVLEENAAEFCASYIQKGGE